MSEAREAIRDLQSKIWELKGEIATKDLQLQMAATAQELGNKYRNRIEAAQLALERLSAQPVERWPERIPHIQNLLRGGEQ